MSPGVPYGLHFEEIGSHEGLSLVDIFFYKILVFLEMYFILFYRVGSGR